MIVTFFLYAKEPTELQTRRAAPPSRWACKCFAQLIEKRLKRKLFSAVSIDQEHRARFRPLVPHRDGVPLQVSLSPLESLRATAASGRGDLLVSSSISAALQSFHRLILRRLCADQQVTRHTSHVTRHTSHVTRHTSHVTRHTSHVTRHTTHVTRHTSHVTRHTSHVTRHTSHVTRHTSHVTHRHCSLLLYRNPPSSDNLPESAIASHKRIRDSTTHATNGRAKQSTKEGDIAADAGWWAKVKRVLTWGLPGEVLCVVFEV
jgi:hypothetical protein